MLSHSRCRHDDDISFLFAIPIKQDYSHAMFHVWRAFRGTQYEHRDERLSVTQQVGLTVYRGWGGCWHYCFLKWSGSASDLISTSSSCLCEENDKRGLRKREEFPDIPGRQRPRSSSSDTNSEDSATDNSVSTATRGLSFQLQGTQL